MEVTHPMYGSNPSHVWEKQNKILILKDFFASKQKQIFKKTTNRDAALRSSVVVFLLPMNNP
jgi:hypothetical protein